MTSSVVLAKRYNYKDNQSLTISIGLLLLFALCFLYVVESNSLMSRERTVQTFQKNLAIAEENVSQLEVQIAQSRFSQSVSESALVQKMVLAERIHYLNLSDSAVAMAR